MAQQREIRMTEPAQIQAEIERARAEITDSVLALRERMNAATDWREWIRRRPLLVFGAAAGIGFWLGYQTGQD